MDFERFARDREVIPGMRVSDLPSDARIYLLHDTGSTHLVVSYERQSWEWREEGGVMVWRVWDSPQDIYARAHGKLISRAQAEEITRPQSYLMLPEGM